MEQRFTKIDQKLSDIQELLVGMSRQMTQYMRSMESSGKGVGLSRTAKELPRSYQENVPGWIPKEEMYRPASKKQFRSAHEELMEELMLLRQNGSVQEYQEAFDFLSCKVKLSEDQLIDCFITGLKQDIAENVRLFRPRTLLATVGIAKLQEFTLHSSTISGGSKNVPRMGSWEDQTCNQQENQQEKPEYVKNLTKGAVGNDQKEDQVRNKDGLEEIRCSHDFPDSQAVKKVRCLRVKKITVANGNKRTIRRVCKGFKGELQGRKINTDALVIPLHECVKASAIQWSKSIGCVQSDSFDLTKQFWYRGKMMKMLLGSSIIFNECIIISLYLTLEGKGLLGRGYCYEIYEIGVGWLSNRCEVVKCV